MSIKIWQLGEMITFGKYNGESIGYIIRMDSGYIDWMLNNNSDFCLSDGAKNLFNESMHNRDADLSVNEFRGWADE